MKGEILSIETTQKLANLEKALKYIDSKLRKAYLNNQLSWSAVCELQSVENILKGKEPLK